MIKFAACCVCLKKLDYLRIQNFNRNAQITNHSIAGLCVRLHGRPSFCSRTMTRSHSRKLNPSPSSVLMPKPRKFSAAVAPLLRRIMQSHLLKGSRIAQATKLKWIPRPDALSTRLCLLPLLKPYPLLTDAADSASAFSTEPSVLVILFILMLRHARTMTGSIVPSQTRIRNVFLCVWKDSSHHTRTVYIRLVYPGWDGANFILMAKLLLIIHLTPIWQNKSLLTSNLREAKPIPSKLNITGKAIRARVHFHSVINPRTRKI